eukprot:924482-Rhodomonas_salina.1
MAEPDLKVYMQRRRRESDWVFDGVVKHADTLNHGVTARLVRGWLPQLRGRPLLWMPSHRHIPAYAVVYVDEVDSDSCSTASADSLDSGPGSPGAGLVDEPRRWCTREATVFIHRGALTRAEVLGELAASQERTLVFASLAHPRLGADSGWGTIADE